MRRRQSSVPVRWLVADTRIRGSLWTAVSRLRPGSGLLFLFEELPKRERARLLAKLRLLARQRGLVIVEESGGESARIHTIRELRRAGLAKVPLIFLSPMFRTRSHPDRSPLPRMRAATLARLANAPVVALGGMDERRFRRIERLGFHGWAGIDAWIRT